MHRKNVTECLPLRWSATRYQSFVFYCPLTIPKIWSFESLSEEKFSFRSYPWAMIRFTLTTLKNYFVLIVYQIFYQILNEGKWYSWALSTWIGPLDLHFILKRLSIKLCYISFSIFQISQSSIFLHNSLFFETHPFVCWIVWVDFLQPCSTVSVFTGALGDCFYSSCRSSSYSVS